MFNQAYKLRSAGLSQAAGKIIKETVIKEDFERYEHEYEFYNDEYYQKVNLIHENEQKEFGNILEGLILLGYSNNSKMYLLLKKTFHSQMKLFEAMNQ